MSENWNHETDFRSYMWYNREVYQIKYQKSDISQLSLQDIIYFKSYKLLKLSFTLSSLNLNQ